MGINAPEELLETSDLLQAVFDSAPNGIAVMQAVYDSTGKVEDFAILLFNAYTLNWIGDTDYKGKRYSNVFPMVKETGILEKFIEVAETGTTTRFERWYPGEGMKHWFRFAAVKQGELLVVTTEDITDQKRAEEALRKSEEFNRTALESSPDCVKVLDTEGRLTYMNYNGTCIMEIDDFNTVKNKSWWELWPDDSKEDVKGAIAKAFRGEAAQFQAFCPTAKGTPRWWDVVVSPIANADGPVSQLISVSRDVTEKRKAADALKESEERFRTMIEQAPVAIGLTRGKDFVFESINGPMLQIIHQQSKKDVVGKKMIEEVLPEMRDQPIHNMLRQVLQTGETFSGIEVQVLLTLDGVLYNGYYNISYTRIVEPDGTPSIMHMAIDVTDQVMARRTVEESEGKLKAIVQQTPAPTLVLRGNDFLVEHINTPMLQMMGREDGIIGKPFLSLMPELEGQFAWEQVKKVYHQGTAFDQEEVLVAHKRNGVLQNHYYNVAYRPLKEEGGITGMIQVAIDITEQVLSRKKLEESEERYRTLLEETTVATAFYTSPEIQIQYANATMLHYWGRGSEVIGKTFRQALPELEGQPFPALLEAVYATGEPYIGTEEKAELEIDGELRPFYFNFTYKALRNAEGQIYAIHHTAMDVTEQVEARNKLEESYQVADAYLRNVFMQTPAVICILKGPQHVYTLANKQYNEIVGNRELLGKPVREALPEFEGQGFFELLDEVYQTGKPFYGNEVPVKLDKGRGVEDIFLNFVYEPTYDADKKVDGILVLAVEVTEQVTVRKKIEESEDALRSLVLGAPVGMCVIDAATLMSEVVNESFVDIAGKPHEAIAGHRYWDTFAEAKPYYEAALQAVIDTGVAYYANEVELMLIRHGKEEMVYVTFVYMPLKNSEGRVKKVAIYVLENTPQVVARRRVEELVTQRTAELANANESLHIINKELQRSNANLEEFAHAASHDLKEPVRKVHYFTQYLKEQLTAHLTETELRSFGRIENATERMGALIDDLLLYSHVSQRPHEMEMIDLNVKVQRVLEDLELDIEEKRAVIEVAKLPVLQGYKRQLQQLFQNLISNALKYSKRDIPPHIEISATEAEENDETYNVILVKDNGIGFDQAHAEKIFQMFARLHGKQEYSGTGVGLSIAKKVVENHKGFIRVESEVGAGSVFKIYLPA